MALRIEAPVAGRPGADYNRALTGEDDMAAKPFYAHLYVQVLIGVALGAAFGLIWPHLAAQPWVRLIGDLFVKLIRMTIAVLIFCTVSAGIGKVRSAGQVGRVGVKALVYFEVMSTLALVLGLIVANLTHPGEGLHAAGDAAAVAQFTAPDRQETLSGFLSALIPDSFLSGLVKGDILQTLLIAVFTGFALMRLGERAAKSGIPVLITP